MALGTPGAGEIEETLKWGEPADMTKNGAGSTIRLDWKPKHPDHYALYFNCKTTPVLPAGPSRPLDPGPFARTP